MRGFIFYIPDDGTSQPPLPSSSVWDLGDNGAWKAKYGFPVYAVPSDIGQEMIRQSSLYSGNMTTVPYGHEISELPGIDPRDYVRLYTELHVSITTATLSYPILLVIIVAVLFVMVGITSAIMHLIWRFRRKSLRRRVANGDVNLEALGIKRLTVPREHITKLPLLIYTVEEETKLAPVLQLPPKNSSTTTTNFEHNVAREASNANRDSKYQELALPTVPILDDTFSDPDSVLSHKYLPYSQQTCPICLEDFESGTTPIRELPCGHIFHPECIDSFLNNNSSLCPMCKKSVLPKGYCATQITNAMVRRERNIRRLRSRIMVNDEGSYIEPDNLGNRMRRYLSQLWRTLLHSTALHGPDEDESITVPMEPQFAVMTTALAADTHLPVSGNSVPENPEPGLTRQEITQQRIQELTLRQPPDSDAIEARRSKG